MAGNVNQLYAVLDYKPTDTSVFSGAKCSSDRDLDSHTAAVAATMVALTAKKAIVRRVFLRPTHPKVYLRPEHSQD